MDLNEDKIRSTKGSWDQYEESMGFTWRWHDIYTKRSWDPHEERIGSNRINIYACVIDI